MGVGKDPASEGAVPEPTPDSNNQGARPMTAREPHGPGAVDADPVETQEWIDSLDALTDREGASRAQFVLLQLQDRARLLGVTREGLYK